MKIYCILKDKTYIQVAKNVAHCWNGYGQKEKFLPQRLYSQISNEREHYSALKNSSISLTKNIAYMKKDEFLDDPTLLQREDKTIILGGYSWLKKNHTTDDSIVEE